MKQYHQTLIKIIGGEYAERIFTAIYVTIPSYLLPEKAASQTKNLPSNPVDPMTNGDTNNGDKQEHSSTRTDPQKGNGMGNMVSGQMNSMNNTNMTDPMGTSGMPGMNTNGDTSKTAGSGINEQLISQLQTSNATLTQMFTSLQQKNGVSQTQLYFTVSEGTRSINTVAFPNMSTANISSG